MKLARLFVRDREDVVLNQVRVKLGWWWDAKASLHIKSTLDNTHHVIQRRIDEAISFPDEDLIAIQNKGEGPVRVTIKAIRLPAGKRAILRPSRGGHVTLVDPRVSKVRSETTFHLGAGESCMLCSSQWQPKVGHGPAFPV